jgi:hypothetical protein
MAKATPLSLEELNELMQRLHATLDILVGHSGGKRGARGGGVVVARGNGARARGPRRDRSAGKELQGKLHETLKGAKNGMSLGELAEKVGSSKETIGYHLRVLRGGKRARVTGTRGTARWHAA